MKNVNIITFVLICFLILIDTSCKPKPSNKDCKLDGTCPAQYYRMELGDAKAYLWAKPGSYWIYKNTATGDLDTQTCTGFYFDSISVRGTEPSTSFITIKYDILSRYIRSSFDKQTFHDETGGYAPDAPLRPLKTVLNRYSGIGYIEAFSHPFVIGEQFSNGSSTMTCKGMDSNLIIQSKKYNNVASFDIDIDVIWYDDNSGVPIYNRYPATTYIWSKDVGLVKRTNRNEKYSWELIDYNLIQ